jgi:hypothetical protein
MENRIKLMPRAEEKKGNLCFEVENFSVKEI